MTDRRRYRVTRPAFDVISVFGSLRASAVPGPVFAAVLGLRGYTESAVRNQIARLVQRDYLHRRSVGRVTVYELAESLRPNYSRLAGEGSAPEYTGEFAALVLAIPESRRSVRDQVLYSARYAGYRQLRPGLLIAVDEAIEPLREVVLADVGPESEGWLEFCRIVPEDLDQARRWADRAFEVSALSASLAELEESVAACVRDSAAAGPVAPEDFVQEFSAYFDLYFAVSGRLMTAPALPEELAPGLRAQERMGALMGDLNGTYGERFAPRVFEEVGSLASRDLIEFEDPQMARMWGAQIPEGTAAQV